MIIRAVVVPHPPLLVPELVGGGVNETAAVREATLAAVRALAEVADDWLAVAADPAGPVVIDPAAHGTFRGYGVDVRVALSEPAPVGTTPPSTSAEAHTGSPTHGSTPIDARPAPATAAAAPAGPPAAAAAAGRVDAKIAGAGTAVSAGTAGAAARAVEVSDLPLPALIAGWLREEAGARRVRVRLVPPDLPVEDCQRVGAELAAAPGRWGLLVLGDGSNRHGDRAPGRPDERAGAFDDAVRAALAAGDPAGLLALDPQLAGELGAPGRAPWQILAAATAPPTATAPPSATAPAAAPHDADPAATTANVTAPTTSVSSTVNAVSAAVAAADPADSAPDTTAAADSDLAGPVTADVNFTTGTADVADLATSTTDAANTAPVAHKAADPATPDPTGPARRVTGVAAVDRQPTLWRATLLYSDAPFGVAYHVAIWDRPANPQP